MVSFLKGETYVNSTLCGYTNSSKQAMRFSASCQLLYSCSCSSMSIEGGGRRNSVLIALPSTE